MVVFFKPNTAFVKWLIEYAGDRIIIDAGCGEQFPLSKQLIENGAKKVVSIDPYLDLTSYMNYRIMNMNRFQWGSYHGLPSRIQDMSALFNNGHQDVLIVFARPCHGNFVYETIQMKGEGVEVLYITKPENIEKYDDIGEYMDTATLLEHKGSSADDEVVYSVK